MPSALLANLRTQWDQSTAQITAITERAAAENRDMNDVERANFDALRTQQQDLQPRIEQLVDVERSHDATAGLFASISHEGRTELERATAPATIAQYHSPGEYLYDVFRSFGQGADLDARQRITRAAYVQRTTVNGATVADVTIDDLLGIVPEPIIGPVWSSIDAERRLISVLTQRTIVAPLMFRPKVTQHTQVGPQGVAGKLGSLKTTGAAVDEKKPFVSRDLKLARIDIEPIALGGVVDVSLWAEMMSPGVLDMIVSDLAAEYAIQTEALAAAEVVRAAAVNPVPAAPAAITAQDLNKWLYQAAAMVYANSGKLPTHVGMSVDVWAEIGGLVDSTNRPLLPALGATNAMGTMSPDTFSTQNGGFRWIVSPGFPPNTLVVFAASGIETFERRLGVLQAIEPERAGRVVSYSGLFTSVAIDDGVAAKVNIT